MHTPCTRHAHHASTACIRTTTCCGSCVSSRCSTSRPRCCVLSRTCGSTLLLPARRPPPWTWTCPLRRHRRRTRARVTYLTGCLRDSSEVYTHACASRVWYLSVVCPHRTYVAKIYKFWDAGVPLILVPVVRCDALPLACACAATAWPCMWAHGTWEATRRSRRGGGSVVCSVKAIGLPERITEDTNDT